jgi:poly(3-hydroxybutyrate) depolymerase
VPRAQRARLSLSLLLALLLGSSSRAEGDGTGDPLAEELARIVDLPSARERADMAAAAARLPGVGIPAWRAAIAALRPTTTPEPGTRTETVPLRVLDVVEPTEIVTYVPRSLAGDRSAPLLLSFHGAGGRGSEAAASWVGAAEMVGAIVVAPTEAGPNDGYRFTARERASALATLRWAKRRFDVDEDRVVVTGFSRGGHMAWDVALRHPDLFAAVVPLLGAPRLATQRGENNLRFLENLVAVPIRDLQGARDDPRAVANVHAAFERLAALGAKDARLVEFADRAHDVDFGAVDWPAFLGAARRDPVPTRVVRLAASRDEARAHWAEILEVDRTVEVEPKPPRPPGWGRMDEAARRRFVAGEVDERTARLVVVRSAPGRFEATSTRVRRFRLRLPAETLEPGKPVTVVWNRRVISKPAPTSAAVLLGDFVERLDRRFLPVAEVTIP